MGLVASLFERRSSLENPRTSLSDPADWLWDAFGASKSKAGVSVNEKTALSLGAVFACVRVLAEGVASLPLEIYKRRKDGGKDRAVDHPAYQLLHNRPTPELPSVVWREVLMTHLALRGNAFCEKEYNGRGDVIGLWPISPDRVTVERRNRVKTYTVNVNGARKPMPADLIMHIPGLGYDGLVGYSPITIARDAIGAGLAAQEHGALFFGNSAEPSGVLEHPGKLSKEAKAKLKESWEKMHGGDNRFGVAVLEENMKYQQIGLSNRDSQFLETRKFHVTEIARFFRVPPHMIADLDRSTNNNIEQQSLDFVVHTLRPWLVLWEQILNWELFDEAERALFFCEFNIDGLLRGDSAARAAFYTGLFNIGGLSVNEIREKENLNPVEGGDKRFVPLNMQSLENAGAPPPTPTSPAPAAPANGDQNNSNNQDGSARALSTLQPLVRDALERAAMRERSAALRAIRRGELGFRAWLVEYEEDQAEYIVRALVPIAKGALAMLATRELSEGDMRLVRAIATGEVASHLRAYRTLEEPTEAVVADLLDRITPDVLDTLAGELAGQLVGAMAGGRAMRSAAGAPVVNVGGTTVHPPDIHVAPAITNLDLHLHMPKPGTKTATITDGEGNVRSTITVGEGEAA